MLAVGSSGAAVRQLQQLLINAGQSVGGGIDGIYGTMTANAVKRFQQAKGLPVTGTVDAATLQALQAAGSAAAAPAGTIAQGARGNQVTSVQRALIAAGFAVAGGADGIYGAATANAVKQFQQARGLLATGIVDQQTLAALGSAPAAPAAAPRPPPAARRGIGHVARRSARSGCAARPCRRCSGRSSAWAGRWPAAPTASSAPARRRC